MKIELNKINNQKANRQAFGACITNPELIAKMAQCPKVGQIIESTIPAATKLSEHHDVFVLCENELLPTLHIYSIPKGIVNPQNYEKLDSYEMAAIDRSLQARNFHPEKVHISMALSTRSILDAIGNAVRRAN